MAVAPFGDYQPDLSDINGSATSILANVLPRADGYGPFRALQEFSETVGAACRGYFCANRTDGTIAVFAATATRLYMLSNTTLAWTDVSKGTTDYTTVNADRQWQFAQFNNLVYATQANTVLQVFDLTSSSEFANNSGSPPQAGGIAIVNRFIVLFDLLSDPNSIAWSGLNATTTWTSGVNYSDTQSMPDGGRVLGVAGGEFGLILQAQAVRSMTFTPGSAVVFHIERLELGRGILAPYTLCQGGNRVFWLAPSGFVEATPTGGITQIGTERVDRTVLADIDTGQIQLAIAAADPARHIVMFVYKSLSGSSGVFDKGLVYNWLLKKWAPVNVSGEYLAPAARPGLTLEALDALAPGAVTVSNATNNGSGLIRLTVSSTSGWSTGDVKTVSGISGTTEANASWTITVINGTTIDLQSSTFSNAYVTGGVVGGSIDALTLSLDELSTATLPSLAAMSSAHKLGFFSGDTLEATLSTGELIATRRRTNINGMQPITDADSVFAYVKTRDALNDTPTDSDESEMDSDGYCPMLAEGRSARAVLRIPAGTDWTFASGVEPELLPAGRY